MKTYDQQRTGDALSIYTALSLLAGLIFLLSEILK
jgi:hypothetical protein